MEFPPYFRFFVTRSGSACKRRYFQGSFHLDSFRGYRSLAYYRDRSF